jgi:hypothetical protein
MCKDRDPCLLQDERSPQIAGSGACTSPQPRNSPAAARITTSPGLGYLSRSPMRIHRRRGAQGHALAIRIKATRRESAQVTMGVAGSHQPVSTIPQQDQLPGRLNSCRRVSTLRRSEAAAVHGGTVQSRSVFALCCSKKGAVGLITAGGAAEADSCAGDRWPPSRAADLRQDRLLDARWRRFSCSRQTRFCAGYSKTCALTMVST